MKLFFFIVFTCLSILFSCMCVYGQNSLFNGDTVRFNYVRFDENDSTFIHYNLDTVKSFRMVFIDSNNIVNWSENYNLVPERHYDTTYIKEILNFSDINDISNFKFKVIRKRKKFYYETVGEKKEKIFEANFSTKKSTDIIPFFTIDDIYYVYRGQIPYNLEYTYDTELKINDMLIPCHRYTMSYTQYGLSNFKIGTGKNNLFFLLGVEVYFEKKTLLPIVITSKLCFRTLDVPSSNKFGTDKFYINFYRSYMMTAKIEEQW